MVITITTLRTIAAYRCYGNKNIIVQSNRYKFAILHPINLKLLMYWAKRDNQPKVEKSNLKD